MALSWDLQIVGSNSPVQKIKIFDLSFGHMTDVYFTEQTLKTLTSQK